MALWGTDKSKSEQKPTWQIDKDATGVKGRPAINEQRNTFASQADRSADPTRKHSGWVRRIVKTLPDGTERIIEELLVATSQSAAFGVETETLGDYQLGIDGLADRLGVANITSIDFRTHTIAANSEGYMDLTANIVVDVSFNEAVDINPGTGTGFPVIQIANATSPAGTSGAGRINTTAYPAQWDGVSSTWRGEQNNSNMYTFTIPLSEGFTGNGEFEITAPAVWLDLGTITDNVHSAAANLTPLGGTRKDTTSLATGNLAISTVNVVVLGTANTLEGVG